MKTPDNVLKPGDDSLDDETPSVTTPGVAKIVEVVEPAAASVKVGAQDFLTLLKHRIKFSVGQEWGANLSHQQLHMAISLAVRDVMVDRMLATERRYQKAGAKRLYYLSMEFLVGRSLGNNLC